MRTTLCNRIVNRYMCWLPQVSTRDVPLQQVCVIAQFRKSNFATNVGMICELVILPLGVTFCDPALPIPAAPSDSDGRPGKLASTPIPAFTGTGDTLFRILKAPLTSALMTVPQSRHLNSPRFTRLPITPQLWHVFDVYLSLTVTTSIPTSSALYLTCLKISANGQACNF